MEDFFLASFLKSVFPSFKAFKVVEIPMAYNKKSFSKNSRFSELPYSASARTMEKEYPKENARLTAFLKKVLVLVLPENNLQSIKILPIMSLRLVIKVFP